MSLKYKLNKRYEILDYDSNKFIFDNETGFVYEVNDIGYEIMRLIKKGERLKQIIIYICKEYNKEVKEVQNDICSFISQLLDKEIITLI